MVTLVRITVKVYSQANTEEKSELQQNLGGADSTAEVPDICNETPGRQKKLWGNVVEPDPFGSEVFCLMGAEPGSEIVVKMIVCLSTI
jgi:hypothetical protein